MKIGAVIVTYKPEPQALRALIGKLEASAVSIFVIDNTPLDLDLDVPAIDDCHLIKMGGNKGIAAAQNTGIKAALVARCDAIAFFDQDSNPDNGLIGSLTTALNDLPLGVVVPICSDLRSGDRYPSFRFNRWGGAVPSTLINHTRPQKVDLAISSGSLVSSCVFNRVGMMDEDLFIDYVDFEWCCRCRNEGIPIHVIPSATMAHAIGNRVVKIGPFSVFIHTPQRSYYRLRNPFLLIRKPHVPRLFVFREIAAALMHHGAQLLHSSQKLTYTSVGWRAIKDGLRGKTGKCEFDWND